MGRRNNRWLTFLLAGQQEAPTQQRKRSYGGKHDPQDGAAYRQPG
jgi:hypothetical protein